MARSIAGDPRGFRELYDRHRPAVFRVARAFATLDDDEVDDVVQESFVRAFRSLAGLREPSRFGPWLLSIARKRALSQLEARRTGLRAAEELEHEAERLAEEAAAIPEDSGPEIALVRRIVWEMPEGPEKETVRLFYIEGELSAREIADRLGVGKSAITMRLERFRAKVKLRLLADVARLRGFGS